MKLIVGLGNPGMSYKKTRHNMGWLTIDELYDKLNLPKPKRNIRFNAEVSEGLVGDEKIILARPLTFMNNSGLSVGALKNYYKLSNKDINIVYDDLDLDFGKLRVGVFESAGGHNGIKSIINFLNGNDFIRFRVGIKNELLSNIPVEKFVLTKFNKEEKKQLDNIINKTCDAIADYLDHDLEYVMNRYN